MIKRVDYTYFIQGINFFLRKGYILLKENRIIST